MGEHADADDCDVREAKARLAAARVLVVGAGGVGSPAALHLAAAGVGSLVIVDPDVVEISNLNRQILYQTADLGRAKADAARERLVERYPRLRVESCGCRLGAGNAVDVVRDVDFIVDATDGVASKFLVNDAAVLAGRPYSHAGVLGFVGQTMTVLPGRTACYRCLFPEPPPADDVPSCREAGILGAVAGLIGAVQAADTIVSLVGRIPALAGRMFTYDGKSRRGRTVRVARNPRCPVCGERPSIKALAESVECDTNKCS